MQPEERGGNPGTDAQHLGPGVAVQGWWQAERGTCKDQPLLRQQTERGRLAPALPGSPAAVTQITQALRVVCPSPDVTLPLPCNQNQKLLRAGTPTGKPQI